jgi:hypothetical protein
VKRLIAVAVALCCTASCPTAAQATSEPPPPLSFGPGDYDLPDPSVGLDALPGYVATLTVSFDGERDGAPERWGRLTSLTARADPPARALAVVRLGADAGSLVRVVTDGARFERVDNGPCTVEVATPVDDSNGDVRPGLDPDEPVAALPGVLGAVEISAEPVASVPSTHYEFDERALGSLDPASVDGDVWVADDSGVVMRYTLVVEGTAAYLGAGVEGRLELDYEVTAIGVQDAIEVPADCPPGLVPLAEPPGATDVFEVPGFTTLTAPAAPAEVQEFYAAQLTAAGWSSTDSIADGDATWASYTLGRLELTVQTAPADGGGTAVTLVLLYADV